MKFNIILQYSEEKQEDGSYGTNGNAIFFFDTQGVYYEWAGDYLLVDQPMKLASPVELVRQVK